MFDAAKPIVSIMRTKIVPRVANKATKDQILLYLGETHQRKKTVSKINFESAQFVMKSLRSLYTKAIIVQT